MSTKKVSTTRGRCLCGAVEFRVAGAPAWVGHCHCASCRRNTGSLIATFAGFKLPQVTYTRGKRRIYESSPGVQRGFCAECGTPLSYEADKFPGEIHLYICTLDDPEHFVAQFHVFYEERVHWFEVADDLPRRPRTFNEP